jgi:hypothetical protein
MNWWGPLIILGFQINVYYSLAGVYCQPTFSWRWFHGGVAVVITVGGVGIEVGENARGDGGTCRFVSNVVVVCFVVSLLATR